MADSMTEARKRMILLLPGKIQQTEPWKKMFTLKDKISFFVFCSKYQHKCSMTKGVKPWISR